MLRINPDEVGYVEVKAAIIVIISPRRSHAPFEEGPVRIGYARRLRDIGECPIAVVAIELIRAEAGEVDIRKAVIRVVAHRTAAAPARHPQRCLGCTIEG